MAWSEKASGSPPGAIASNNTDPRRRQRRRRGTRSPAAGGCRRATPFGLSTMGLGQELQLGRQNGPGAVAEFQIAEFGADVGRGK